MNKHNFKRDHPEVFDEAVSDLDWERIFEYLENDEYKELNDYLNDHIEAFMEQITLPQDVPDPDVQYDEKRQQASELGFESISAMLYGKR